MSRLFVGSLSWGTDADALRNSFSAFGEVTDSFVCKDRETGRSRGFGFVTFSSPDEAERAMDKLDQSELDGRTIKVSMASERTNSGSRGNDRYRAPQSSGDNFYETPMC